MTNPKSQQVSLMSNINNRSGEIKMNRTKQISAKLFPYAIAVVLLANPVVSNSYAEKCVGGNPRICVDFINADN